MTRISVVLGSRGPGPSAPSSPSARPAPRPRTRRSSFNAGLNHLREGRPELAVEEFKKAVKQDPKNPYFQKGLGPGLPGHQRKFDDAVDAFRKALELNPYYVDVRNDLGTALILSGKRATRARTSSWPPSTMPPTPRRRSPRATSARPTSRRRTTPRPSTGSAPASTATRAYPDAYLGLADALVASGRLDEAMATLEAAAKECPQSAAVLLALGEAYSRVGRLGEARTRLEEARRRDPVGPAGRRAAQLLQQFPSK